MLNLKLEDKELHYGHWMEVWAELTEPNPHGHTGLQEGSAGMGGVFGAETAVEDSFNVFTILVLP